MKTCTNCKEQFDTGGFHKDANRKDGLATWCKKCATQSARRYYRDGPISQALNRKRSKIPLEERDRRNRIVTSRLMMRKKYGITFEQYEVMYAEQQGKCLICLKHKDRLAVDHCHSSGTVRGLLCRVCNSGIGLLKDDPVLVARALDYLTKAPIEPQPKTPAAAAIITWQ